MAIDRSGSAYISGYMLSPSTNFGSGVILPGVDLRQSAYIAKYSPAGSLIFAKNAGINPDNSNYIEGGMVN